MTLVWHILRKDLRHTRVFAAASAIFLLVFAAKSYYSFASRPNALRFLVRQKNLWVSFGSGSFPSE